MKLTYRPDCWRSRKRKKLEFNSDPSDLETKSLDEVIENTYLDGCSLLLKAILSLVHSLATDRILTDAMLLNVITGSSWVISANKIKSAGFPKRHLLFTFLPSLH